jgi:hypothetical protein
MNTVEAYRVGIEDPPVYRVWCGSGLRAHWHEYVGLGEHQGCEGVVTLIEATSPWYQGMAQRGPVRKAR